LGTFRRQVNEQFRASGIAGLVGARTVERRPGMDNGLGGMIERAVARLQSRPDVTKAARRILRELREADGRHGVASLMAAVEMHTICGKPTVEHDCVTQLVSCPEDPDHGCLDGVLSFDCAEFKCNLTDGFNCNEEQRFQCGMLFHCHVKHTCAGGHAFYCAEQFECEKTAGGSFFTCKGGRLTCPNPPGTHTCDPPANYDLDDDPGDFICVDPGTKTGTFECQKVFSCESADDFDCSAEADFNCNENFTCTGTGHEFNCVTDFDCQIKFRCKADNEDEDFKCGPYFCCAKETDKFDCPEYECDEAGGHHYENPAE
jgi:hypothetical protein